MKRLSVKMIRFLLIAGSLVFTLLAWTLIPSTLAGRQDVNTAYAYKSPAIAGDIYLPVVMKPGVNEYVVIPGTNVLTVAGFHIPVMPFTETKGNAGAG